MQQDEQYAREGCAKLCGATRKGFGFEKASKARGRRCSQCNKSILKVKPRPPSPFSGFTYTIYMVSPMTIMLYSA